MATTRATTELYLLGSSEPNLGGAKLPNTTGFCILFGPAYRLERGLFRTSSKATCEALFESWAKANIPVSVKHHVITKIEKVFAQWKVLKKDSSWTTAGQKAKEDECLVSLSTLFDIALRHR